MARYTQHPDKIAVVQRVQGKGRLILSGVYPMLMSEYLNREEFTAEQLEDMYRYKDEQKRMWAIFLSYLLNVKSSSRRKEYETSSLSDL